MQVYKLDPARLYSAPNLIWDAMLKSTGGNGIIAGH